MYQRKTLTMIAGSCVKHFLAKRTLADERLLVKKPGRGQGYATRLYLCINKKKDLLSAKSFPFLQNSLLEIRITVTTFFKNYAENNPNGS